MFVITYHRPLRGKRGPQEGGGFQSKNTRHTREEKTENVGFCLRWAVRCGGQRSSDCALGVAGWGAEGGLAELPSG